MSDMNLDPRTGFGSPGTIARRAFGITDPVENAKFVEDYERHDDVQRQRQASGYVDSLQVAERLAPNAVKFIKEEGRSLDESEFGQETGIIPGHMSTDPATVAAGRDLQRPAAGREEKVVNAPSKPIKSPASGFQALYDKIFSKDDVSEPSVTEGLSSSFDR